MTSPPNRRYPPERGPTGNLPRRSGPAQQKIDDPAPADMLAWMATVPEDVGVVAARFFQGVGQDGHVAEVAAVVHPWGHGHGEAAVPGQDGGVEGYGAERVAEDAAEHPGLVLPFRGLYGVPGRLDNGLRQPFGVRPIGRVTGYSLGSGD